MPRELPLDRRAIANQQQSDLKMAGSDQGSVNDGSRPFVAPHRIDGDTHQSKVPQGFRMRRNLVDPECPRLRRWDGPDGLCSNRSAGRLGAVPSIRGTADTSPPGPGSTRRACAAWLSASWNGGVWDSARLVLLLSVQQFLQRLEPGIDPLRLAAAGAAIQVGAALGAQPAA